MVLAMAALVVLATPSRVAAQAVTGTLLGNVTDSSGGAVPGATVTATEVQTNVSRTAISNESGYYIFSSLQNGTFEVSAELQGFKKVVRQGVRVDVNTTVRIDLALEVGQMTEAVTVSAESPLLQTDRTDTGRLIESKMVAELPLTFNRNFQSLLVTVPGSTRPHREHSAFFNSQDSLAVEINGQPRMANNTLIEGLDNNHKTGLLQVIIPAADALETVSVSTSNYDAEFGRAGGAVTNVTIKSGTNDLKGSAFFFGNTDADQRQRLLHAPESADEVRQRRLHARGTHRPQQAVLLWRLPEDARQLRLRRPRRLCRRCRMRNGDFGEVATRIYDPATGDVTGANRVAFANNQIPQDRISPIARRLLALIPEPNIAGAPLGQNNYQKAQTREKTTDGFDAKVNYSMNEKDQMSYRLSFMRPVVFDPGVCRTSTADSPMVDSPGTGTNDSYSSAVTWTRVFSAQTVLDVRGGLNYYHNVTTTEGHGLTTSTELGIPGANLDDYTSGISQIAIASHGRGDPTVSGSRPASRGIGRRKRGTSRRR